MATFLIMCYIPLALAALFFFIDMLRRIGAFLKRALPDEKTFWFFFLHPTISNYFLTIALILRDLPDDKDNNVYFR